VTGVTLQMPAELLRWQAGFHNLSRTLVEQGEEEWQAATEVFFEATQRVVHVITGELKASGKMRVEKRGSQLIGEVRYTADYAMAEERRGGQHAFMTRGWELSQATYRAALGRIYGKVVRSWS
jgi:hypothetical protein